MIISSKRLIEDEDPDSMDLASILAKTQEKLVGSKIKAIVGGQVNELRKEAESQSAQIAELITEVKGSVVQLVKPSEVISAKMEIIDAVSKAPSSICPEIKQAIAESSQAVIDKIVEIENEPEEEEPKKVFVIDVVTRDANNRIKTAVIREQ